jgi:tripartite-type tricarboxylate transporter receptor subunit TctC
MRNTALSTRSPFGLLQALTLSAVMAASAALSHTAHGQSYPDKPVKIIVPVAPGGGLDLVGRLIGGKLTEFWGRQVLVENRPGANSSLGTEATARSAPDGYTLLYVSSGALSINPLLMPELTYDPLRDLVPITLVTTNPFVLLASNTIPVGSVQELLVQLRANPGKLNHASSSATTLLSSELFKALAKVDYVDINYKGGALAAAATGTGETQFTFVDTGSAIAQVKGGRARALAVTSARRSKLQPDIPTISETGVPGYASGAWTVLLAPAKTPAEIVTRINSEVARALASPDVSSRLIAVGNEAFGSSPEVAMQELRADAEKWSRLVKERGIKLK